ncbi:glycosyltransferase family 39 protein [Paenibacillus flagellatus]|uniref:Glycosyltransferase RgtA/B/C/D-like domain-containing protein n=1 Tax=Paenibacillus flagellatus TaxID=2211139 RepID=A0A2V5KEX9_9BACL|nr:glycosyltransferase family 39 protein [Paenibacillus flagellatus]PYI52600.1 hypothetical protein DLM86_20740 [Paenibacillus flagellatus]
MMSNQTIADRTTTPPDEALPVRTAPGTGAHVLTRVLAVFGVALFGWMLWHSAANTAVFFDGGWTIALAMLGSIAAALLLTSVADRWMKRLPFVAVLLLATVGLRLAWVLAVDTQPVSDFLDMYAAGVSAANGDVSFGTNDYFSRWVYQLGFAFYEALLIKLFGNSLLMLKLFNIAFQAGTALVIYRTAALAFNDTCGKMAALLYALYVPNILMCSVLTNQHVSTFLYFLGLMLLIGRSFSGKAGWLFVGLCFGVGNLMRPLGSFFLLGFVAYVVLIRLVPSIRERKWPALAAKTIGVLAVYWLVQQGASFALVQSGVTPYPLSSQEPYWKFMIGLNPQTNGGWSYEDTLYVLQFPLGEERNRAELELLKERLRDKRQVAELFVSKTKTMWGADDSAPLWSMPDQDRPALQKKLIRAERIEYLTMALFGLIAMAVLAIRGRGSPEASLYMLLLLGYAALHVVIEVQTRYRFDIMPCVFVLQSFGLYAAYAVFKRRWGVSAAGG